jgi:hypothetical protein
MKGCVILPLIAHGMLDLSSHVGGTNPLKANETHSQTPSVVVMSYDKASFRAPRIQVQCLHENNPEGPAPKQKFFFFKKKERTTRNYGRLRSREKYKPANDLQHFL